MIGRQEIAEAGAEIAEVKDWLMAALPDAEFARAANGEVIPGLIKLVVGHNSALAMLGHLIRAGELLEGGDR